MKKRLIALVLAVVMCVLALVGCGEYDYSKAKLEKCTTVDVEGFKAALKALTVEDGDFTNEEAERQKQVHDMILRSLFNSDNMDLTERKERSYDNADVLFYAYYVTAKKDGKDLVFDFDFAYNDRSTGKQNQLADTSMIMKQTGGYKYLPYVQAGLYDNDEDVVAKAILEAMKDKDIKDYLYSVNTTKGEQVKAGDFVIVSFSYKFTDESGNETTKTVSDLPMLVPAVGEDYTVPAAVSELKEFGKFAEKLIGVGIGNENTPLYTTPAPEVAEGETVPPYDKAEYTKVTVKGVVDAKEITLTIGDDEGEEKVYTSDDETTKFKDIFGTEHDLTDVELTYHVFPAFYVDVEYTAEAILTVFYGSQIATDLLPIFGSEEYKAEYENENKETLTDTLKNHIERFKAKQATYETKLAALKKAEASFETAKEALEAAKIAVEEAEEAYAKSKAAFEAATVVLEKFVTALARIQEVTDALADSKNAITAENKQKAADKVNEAKNKVAAAIEAVTVAYGTAIKDAKGSEKTALQEEKGKVDEAYTALNNAIEEAITALAGTDTQDAISKITTANSAVAAVQKLISERHAKAVDDETSKKTLAEQQEKILNGDPNGGSETVKKGKKGELEDAEAAYKKADETLNGAEAVADDPNTDEDETKEEVKGAEKEFKEAETARDGILKVVLSAKSDKEGAVAIETAIKKDFEEFVYDTAEEEYFNEIHTALINEVANTINRFVKVDRTKVPKKAIKEVYKKLYEQHKMDFFNSASDDTATSPYVIYGGDFKAYVCAKTGVTTYSDAKDVLWAQATEHVIVIIKIYRAAQVLGYEYTKEEFKAEHDKSEYNHEAKDYHEGLVAQYAAYGLAAYAPDLTTKRDLHIAEQYEKLLDSLMAYETYDKDGTQRPAFNEIGEGIEAKFIYKYRVIAYTVKASEK